MMKRNHWLGCFTPAESVGKPPKPQISSILHICDADGFVSDAFAQLIRKEGGTSGTIFMQGGKRAPRETFKRGH